MNSSELYSLGAFLLDASQQPGAQNASDAEGCGKNLMSSIAGPLGEVNGDSLIPDFCQIYGFNCAQDDPAANADEDEETQPDDPSEEESSCEEEEKEESQGETSQPLNSDSAIPFPDFSSMFPFGGPFGDYLNNFLDLEYSSHSPLLDTSLGNGWLFDDPFSSGFGLGGISSYPTTLTGESCIYLDANGRTRNVPAVHTEDGPVFYVEDPRLPATDTTTSPPPTYRSKRRSNNELRKTIMRVETSSGCFNTGDGLHTAFPVWEYHEPGRSSTFYYRDVDSDDPDTVTPWPSLVEDDPTTAGVDERETTTGQTAMGAPLLSIDVYGNGVHYEYTQVEIVATGDHVKRLDQVVGFKYDTTLTCDRRVLFLVDYIWDDKARLKEVVLTNEEAGSIEISRTTFYYYESGTHSMDIGRENDLVMVRNRSLHDMDSSTSTTRYAQFRYHTDSDGGAPIIQLDGHDVVFSGDARSLKMVFSSERLEEFIDAARQGGQLGTDEQILEYLLTLADNATNTSGSTPIQWAGRIVTKYENSPDPALPDDGVINNRVLEEIVYDDCGCGGGSSKQGLIKKYTYSSLYDSTSYTQALPTTQGGQPVAPPSRKAMMTRVDEFTLDALGSFDMDVPYRSRYLEAVWTRTDTGPEAGRTIEPEILTTVTREWDPASTSMNWIKSRDWISHSMLDSLGGTIASASVASSATTTGYDPELPFAGPPSAPNYDASTSEGLVRWYEYQGQTKRRTKSLISEGWDFYDRIMTHQTVYGDPQQTASEREHLVYESLRYPVEDGMATDGVSELPDDVESTAYAYTFHNTFHGSDDAIATRSTTPELALPAENGPSGVTAPSSTAEYDTNGLMTKSTDLAGIETVYANDPSTGRLTSTTVGPMGHQLLTTYAYDNQGRVTKMTAPGGISTYTIYTYMNEALGHGDLGATGTERPGSGNGPNREVVIHLPHQMYDSGTPANSFCAGPAVFTWMDSQGRVVRTGSYVLNASVDYTSSVAGPPPYALRNSPSLADDVISLSKSTYSTGGQLESTSRWHHVDENAHTTTYEYDGLGRRTRTIDPEGGLSEVVYDVRGRVIETKVGIGGPMGTTTTVSKAFYDATDPVGPGEPVQGVGNGYVTHQWAYTGEIANPIRKVRTHHDFRGRVVATDHELTPDTVTAFDNLDRPIAQAVYENGHALPDLATTDPLTENTSRGGLALTDYDQAGRVWRTQTAINPSSASPDYLASWTWFDTAGRQIAQRSPDSPVSKAAYDNLGRAHKTYLTDDTGLSPGGTSWQYADSVTSQRVIEQTETTYDITSGVPTLSTSYLRPHDAATFGELTSSNAVATYTAQFYDAALRPIGTVNYGTNTGSAGSDLTAGGTAPVLPSSLPAYASSPNQIITSVEYDDAGRVFRTIDPRGVATQTWFDMFGRRVAVAENHVNADVSWNDSGQAQNPSTWTVTNAGGGTDDVEDRVTSFTFDGNGNTVLRTAHTPTGTPDQVTEYVYGSDSGLADDSGMAQHRSVLAEVRYPDETTGQPGTTDAYKAKYAYNNLGEMIAMTDQNGTKHVYTRDLGGRVTSDSVAAFGSGIDTAVEEITTTYDAMGRVDKVTSRDTNGTALNEVEYDYNELGQITDFYQDHDGVVQKGSAADDTAVVSYQYLAQGWSLSNSVRQTAMRYPSFEGGSFTTVLSYNYPPNGSISRPNRIVALNPGSGPVVLVEYGYLGLSTPVVVDYAQPDVQLDHTVAHDGTRTTSGGITTVYPGLDIFGRTKAVRWVDGGYTAHATIPGRPDRPAVFEQLLTYDTSSRILFSVDGRDDASWATRDREFRYDDLNRLVEEKMGAYTGGATPEVTMPVGYSANTWTLDQLGNWSQNTRDPSFNYTGIPTETRAHNAANELTSYTDGGFTSNLTYDDNGNLKSQYNGFLDYEYDAWNRLVRAKEGATTYAEYEYNGLGHRTVKRVDRDLTGSFTFEHLTYYNPSWQIFEEHVTDSTDAMNPVSWASQQFWGLRSIDDSIAKIVDTDLEANRSDWFKGWSAGANGSDIFYSITNHQFSVVAILDGLGRLVERVEYDGYGSSMHTYAYEVGGYSASDAEHAAIITGSVYTADADLNRDGVLTLADSTSPSTNYASQASASPADQDFGEITGDRSVVKVNNFIGYAGYRHDWEFGGDIGRYHVRHRYYDASLGRWMRRDPAGYVDGGNLYEYGRSSPVSGIDPYGLAWQYVSGEGEFYISMNFYRGGLDGLGAGVDIQFRPDSDSSKCCQDIRWVQIYLTNIWTLGANKWILDSDDEPYYPFRETDKGRFSYTEAGKKFSPRSALLDDQPHANRALWGFDGYVFYAESCAVCAEKGTNEFGDVYGCVKWQYEFDPEPKYWHTVDGTSHYSTMISLTRQISPGGGGGRTSTGRFLLKDKIFWTYEILAEDESLEDAVYGEGPGLSPSIEMKDLALDPYF